MGASLLVLDEVSKAFRTAGRSDPAVAAVEGITLSVDRGETVGLVGGSGAGKSTIARLVAGLIVPDAGRMWFDGQDLGSLGRRQRKQVRRRMHLVFQDPYASLAPSMPVAAIVAEPLVIHRGVARSGRRARVLAALDEVRLLPPEQYADRYPHELSGGERQRVALARALVHRPELIIADEPTAMLDAPVRASLVRLMSDMRDTHGTAFMYITHDLALADGFCDRLVVLRDGRVVEEGPTDEVVSRPQHPYTATLLEAARGRPPAESEAAAWA